jgi:hypothetical protein
MKNSNESYYADQYFNGLIKCNRINSFSNFYQPYSVCNSSYPDSIDNSFKSDSSRKDFMNIAYGLLLSFNNFLKDCSLNASNTLESCIITARNASIIKPYLKNVSLPYDFRKSPNSKLFDDMCNGFVVKYTIDRILPPISAPKYEK